ncbi:uncharacterized protein I206_100241 [Kwoniella pini CBS 10737]|uniref:RING-type domain-containing protein n=1 Tax=Kwoniella pini CBS 10737 TaxID=1296096 RepID=A0A1B9IE47_9TREE|nr:uncharacterized protein I206_01084 [Kwoniella pini CBS 10737]OCF53777.1 hypothetical protein I206_01084 [Kwoniella pini CBS 10737]
MTRSPRNKRRTKTKGSKRIPESSPHSCSAISNRSDLDQIVRGDNDIIDLTETDTEELPTIERKENFPARCTRSKSKFVNASSQTSVEIMDQNISRSSTSTISPKQKKKKRKIPVILIPTSLPTSSPSSRLIDSSAINSLTRTTTTDSEKPSLERNRPIISETNKNKLQTIKQNSRSYASLVISGSATSPGRLATQLDSPNIITHNLASTHIDIANNNEQSIKTTIEMEAECVICSEELSVILSKAEDLGKGGLGGGLSLWSCELVGCGALYCIECVMTYPEQAQSKRKSKSHTGNPACPACTREWDRKGIQDQARAYDPIKYGHTSSLFTTPSTSGISDQPRRIEGFNRTTEIVNPPVITIASPSTVDRIPLYIAPYQGSPRQIEGINRTTEMVNHSVITISRPFTSDNIPLYIPPYRGSPSMNMREGIQPTFVPQTPLTPRPTANHTNIHRRDIHDAEFVRVHRR